MAHAVQLEARATLLRETSHSAKHRAPALDARCLSTSPHPASVQVRWEEGCGVRCTRGVADLNAGGKLHLTSLRQRGATRRRRLEALGRHVQLRAQLPPVRRAANALHRLLAPVQLRLCVLPPLPPLSGVRAHVSGGCDREHPPALGIQTRIPLAELRCVYMHSPAATHSRHPPHDGVERATHVRRRRGGVVQREVSWKRRACLCYGAHGPLPPHDPQLRHTRCMLLQAARRASNSLTSAVASVAVPTLLATRVPSVPAAPTAVAAMSAAAAEAPPAAEIKAGVVPDGYVPGRTLVSYCRSLLPPRGLGALQRSWIGHMPAGSASRRAPFAWRRWVRYVVPMPVPPLDALSIQGCRVYGSLAKTLCIAQASSQADADGIRLREIDIPDGTELATELSSTARVTHAGMRCCRRARRRFSW